MSDDPADDAPIELAVTDVLDLHSFAPSEVGELVRDYLDLAVERGFAQVRIVHGRGVGVQRQRVRRILELDRGWKPSATRPPRRRLGRHLGEAAPPPASRRRDRGTAGVGGAPRRRCASVSA